MSHKVAYEYNPEFVSESAKINTEPTQADSHLADGSNNLFTTGNRLVSIFYKQYERRCLILLLRAFKRWRFEYPLAIKCDELMRQLKERNSALESVRSSYLKDVISVKYHLDLISNIPVDNTKQLKDAVFELHTVPSADIRQIIDIAKQGWSDTSSQLRETLIDAGILDPFTIKTLNSWEQSRSFKRMMRVQRGPSYQYPEAGGESMMLKAPSTHRLFVRYCQDCIGLMTLVKNWNNEVEASMKFKADYGQIDEKINEFKKLIKSLQGIIEEKEKEVLYLVDKTVRLEEANAWFEKWSNIKDAEEKANLQEEKHKIHLNCVGMAGADRESTIWNLNQRHAKEVQDLLEQELELQQMLQRERYDRDLEVEARLRLAQEVQSLQFDKNTLLKEADQLKHTIGQHDHETNDLLRKILHLQQLNDDLQKALHKKEVQFEEYRNQTTERLNDLQQQIQVLTADLESKENEVDTLREDIRTKKALLSKQSIELTRLQESVETLQSRLEVFTKPAPIKRLTLKVVARAVLSVVQFFRRLQRKEYESLGIIGYRIMLRQQRHELERVQDALQESQLQRQQCEKLINKLEHDAERFMSQIKDLRSVTESREKELKALKQSIVKQQQEMQELLYEQKEMKQNLSMFQEQEENSIYLKNTMTLTMKRLRIFVHLQRNLSQQLSRILWKTRWTMTTWDVENSHNMWSQTKRLMENLENGIMPADYYASAAVETVDSPSRTVESLEDSNGSPATSPKKRNKRPTMMNRPKKKISLNSAREYAYRMILWHRGQRAAFSMSVKLPYQDWMRWVRGDNIDPITGQLKETNDEHILRIRMFNQYKDELRQIQNIKDSVNQEVKSLDDYLCLVKQCYVHWKDKLEHYYELEAAYRELLDKRKRPGRTTYVMPSDRSVTSRGSETREQRKQLMKMKSSFNHLLDQDITTYLSNILGAIDNVQTEHGHLYSDENNGADNAINSNNNSGKEVAAPPIAKAQSFKADSSEGNSNSTKSTSKDRRASRLAKMKSQKFVPEQAIVMEEDNHDSDGDIADIVRPSSKSVSAKRASMVKEQPTEEPAESKPSVGVVAQIVSKAEIVENVEQPQREKEKEAKRVIVEEPKPVMAHEEKEQINQTPIIEKPMQYVPEAKSVLTNPPVVEVKPEVQELPAATEISKQRSPRVVEEFHQANTTNEVLPDIVEATNEAIPQRNPSIASSRVTPKNSFSVPNQNEDPPNTATDVDIAQSSAPTSFSFVAVEPGNIRSSIVSTISALSAESETLSTNNNLIDRSASEDYESADYYPDVSRSASQTVVTPTPPMIGRLGKQRSKGVLHIPRDDDDDSNEGDDDGYHSPNYRVGVEPIPPDDEDDFDDLDDDEDEDNSFHAELELMKKEATMFLAHDSGLRDEIMNLKTENTSLTVSKSQLESDIKVLRSEFETMKEEQYKLRFDLTKYMAEHEQLSHENSLLREMVEDGYRYHSDEKAEIITTVKKHLEKQEDDRLQRKKQRKETGTQISCSVCAIRDFHHQHPELTAPSNPLDQTSYVEIHPGMAKIFGEDVVLVPRPRPRTIDTIRQSPNFHSVDFDKLSYDQLMEKILKFADDVVLAKEQEEALKQHDKKNSSRKSSDSSKYFVDQVLDVLHGQNQKSRPTSPLRESVKIPHAPVDRATSVDHSSLPFASLDVTKYPYSPNPLKNTLNSNTGHHQQQDSDTQNRMVLSADSKEQSKHMFDYAKSFLRPQSATQKQASSSATQTKTRPKSSYAQSSNKVHDPAKDKLITSYSSNHLLDDANSHKMDNELQSNNDNPASSKFRKLKQIPASNSIAMLSEGSSGVSSQHSARAQLLIKNLLHTQQDQRTISHTAAFLQGPHLHGFAGDVQRSQSAKQKKTLRNHTVSYYDDDDDGSDGGPY